MEYWRETLQQTDLMFRNESVNVIKKAKAKVASKSKSDSPAFIDSTPAPEQKPEKSLILVRQNRAPVLTPSNLYHSMAPTIDEIATGFFFTNYILDVDRCPGNSAGYEIDDTLSNCMKAVGLITLANAVHAPELIQEVRFGGSFRLGISAKVPGDLSGENPPPTPAAGGCNFFTVHYSSTLSWLMNFVALGPLPESVSRVLSQFRKAPCSCCAP